MVGGLDMKKLFYTLLAATALMACAKEADFNNTRDNEVINENGLVSYTFHALFEDLTKASINESGKFSWGDAGTDQIAVWDAAHSEYVTFTSTDNNGNFSCEAKPGASFKGQTAYYPASVVSTGEFVFPTTFASIDKAAKGFPMSGTVTDDGKIPFAHLGCLINITLNNVPSFTTKLILNYGTNKDITVSVTPSAGVINAVVPIPAGTYVLTAKLEDDNSNVFYTKARRASKAYAARNYYPISPITLGKLLTFTNEAGWASPKVHIWQTDNTGNNVDITTGGTYPHRLFLRNTNVYYVLLDGDVETWTSEGNGIGVQFYSNETDKTETACVYLYRNIDFTIPGGGGLKTSYRTYLRVNNGSWANDAGANIRDQYNDPKSFTPMTKLSTKFYYYEWPSSYYGWGLYIEMQNSSNKDWYVPDRSNGNTNWWVFTLNRDLIYTKN